MSKNDAKNDAKDDEKVGRLPPSIEALEALVRASAKHEQADSINDLAVEILKIKHARLFKHLKSLQRFCTDAKIFTEGPNGKLMLTAGGKKLVELAQDVVNAHRRIRAAPENQELVFCCSHLTATAFLPQLLRAFRDSLPENEAIPKYVVRETDTPEEFLDMMHRGTVDVAIRGQAFDTGNRPVWEVPKGVSSIDIGKKYYLAAIAPKRTFKNKKVLLSELLSTGRVAVQKAIYSNLLDFIGEEIDPNVVWQNVSVFDSHAALIRATQAGNCIAIAPQIEMEACPDLETATIDDLQTPIVIFMALWNDDRLGFTGEDLVAGKVEIPGRDQPWRRKHFVTQFLLVCKNRTHETTAQPAPKQRRRGH